MTRERELTLEVLHHLREVERRQLFAQLGFSSLFEYAVKELAYSEGSAHRRISSMRLLKVLPVIEPKIENGALPLSTLSQAQTFFRQEKITAPAVKMELLTRLEGKSAREVERVLVSASSTPELRRKDSTRLVAENVYQLTFTADDKLVEKIEELKALLSHRNPKMSLGQLVKLAIDDCLAKHRIKEPKARGETRVGVKPQSSQEQQNTGNREIGEPRTERIHDNPPPTLELETNRLQQSRSRYVPAEIRRRVWARDNGRCSFVDPGSGRCCESEHLLQLDHEHPHALGGEPTEENLRLRCAAHNRLAATVFFGRETMRRYVPSLQ